jgi:hypothetical protein
VVPGENKDFGARFPGRLSLALFRALVVMDWYFVKYFSYTRYTKKAGKVAGVGSSGKTF